MHSVQIGDEISWEGKMRKVVKLLDIDVELDGVDGRIGLPINATRLEVFIDSPQEPSEEYVVTGDGNTVDGSGEGIYWPNPPQRDGGWKEVHRFNGEDGHPRTLWRRRPFQFTDRHAANIGRIVLHLAHREPGDSINHPIVSIIDQGNPAADLIAALARISEETAAGIVRQLGYQDDGDASPEITNEA